MFNATRFNNDSAMMDDTSRDLNASINVVRMTTGQSSSSSLVASARSKTDSNSNAPSGPPPVAPTTPTRSRAGSRIGNTMMQAKQDGMPLSSPLPAPLPPPFMAEYGGAATSPRSSTTTTSSSTATRSKLSATATVSEGGRDHDAREQQASVSSLQNRTQATTSPSGAAAASEKFKALKRALSPPLGSSNGDGRRIGSSSAGTPRRAQRNVRHEPVPLSGRTAPTHPFAATASPAASAAAGGSGLVAAASPIQHPSPSSMMTPSSGAVFHEESTTTTNMNGATPLRTGANSAFPYRAVPVSVEVDPASEHVNDWALVAQQRLSFHTGHFHHDIKKAEKAVGYLQHLVHASEDMDFHLHHHNLTEEQRTMAVQLTQLHGENSDLALAVDRCRQTLHVATVGVNKLRGERQAIEEEVKRQAIRQQQLHAARNIHHQQQNQKEQSGGSDEEQALMDKSLENTQLRLDRDHDELAAAAAAATRSPSSARLAAATTSSKSLSSTKATTPSGGGVATNRPRGFSVTSVVSGPSSSPSLSRKPTGIEFGSAAQTTTATAVASQSQNDKTRSESCENFRTHLKQVGAVCCSKLAFERQKLKNKLRLEQKRDKRREEIREKSGSNSMVTSRDRKKEAATTPTTFSQPRRRAAASFTHPAAEQRQYASPPASLMKRRQTITTTTGIPTVQSVDSFNNSITTPATTMELAQFGSGSKNSNSSSDGDNDDTDPTSQLDRSHREMASLSASFGSFAAAFMTNAQHQHDTPASSTAKQLQEFEEHKNIAKTSRASDPTPQVPLSAISSEIRTLMAANKSLEQECEHISKHVERKRVLVAQVKERGADTNTAEKVLADPSQLLRWAPKEQGGGKQQPSYGSNKGGIQEENATASSSPRLQFPSSDAEWKEWMHQLAVVARTSTTTTAATHDVSTAGKDDVTNTLGWSLGRCSTSSSSASSDSMMMGVHVQLRSQLCGLMRQLEDSCADLL